MSYSMVSLRNEKITSLYGRRIALDRRDFLIGPSGLRLPIDDLGTVATTLSYDAVSRVRTSGSTQGPTQHNLPVPVIGMTKVICMTSTSTGSAQFLSTPNGAAIFPATLGTTMNCVNFIGPAASITLRAVSGSEWAIESMAGVAGITFTTST